MDNHLLMTASYLTSMIAEMEHTLGCEIKIVEDKDSRYPCKLEYARNYARLFTVPDPKADEARPLTDFLNPDSGKVVTAWCEPAVAELKPLERIQLERLAYFCADSRLSVPGKPVLNRTVTLRYNAPWLNNHPERRRT